MYFLFRGQRRGSGEPVIGRVFALTEDAAHALLETHAIRPDTLGPEESGGLFPPALEAAFDEAGLRITFNQLARVHEGHGVWTLIHEKIPARVMKLAREVVGGAESRQHLQRRIEELLDQNYGDHPGGAAFDVSRFASADDVRAEVRRLMTAINKLERELVSMRSRPGGHREPRRAAARSTTRNRTQDDVLREIFEHNLELMKLA